ncbi:low-affinity glucose transporter HXT3 [Xylariaceae sp. FL0804]|nr:low-affinity glucose transporter HXT3 [Xylariaceae sp. FL0804]
MTTTSPVEGHEPNHSERKGLWQMLRENPFIFGLSMFASLGGFLFGYDQGVVSEVLTMESFAAKFPRVYLDSSFQGWFVSTLLLLAWLGSLINGPLADHFGRKGSMLMAVVVFVIGSSFQAGADSIPMVFAGRAVAGLAIGMLTMIVPMYMSEVSTPEIRGTLVVLQQLSITLGILVSYWIEYGTQFIGGTRCAPDIPYTGGTEQNPTFNPLQDVGPNGCTGQSEASWRIPFALQIAPAVVLGIGMLFFPESPRYFLMRHNEDKALSALAKLRRVHPDTESLRHEFLAIKAEVLFDESVARDKFPGKAGVSLFFAQYASLVSSWPSFKRLAVGCCIMFFQQFMGCNAIIYYAPTMFKQLGLSGGTASLLATGVYGIVNTLSTLPALFLIDRVGRRPLLMCGAAGTFVSLVIVGGIVGGLGDALATHQAAGYAGMAFIFLYDVNFSYSFAPIGWVLPSEIFNLGHRSKAMAVTTSATWMCNFVVGLATPAMLARLGWGTYIFFAAFCLLALLFVFFCVPETRGRSLEDMDAAFGDTAAHEEKARLFEIAAAVGLTEPLPLETEKAEAAQVDAVEV